MSKNFIDSTLFKLNVKWSCPPELAPVTTITPLASAALIIKFVLINLEAY